MIPQNKNVRQLVWHLYINTAVENSEIYYYNTEGDRNSVVSQVSCGKGMDTAWVTGINHHIKTDQLYDFKGRPSAKNYIEVGTTCSHCCRKMDTIWNMSFTSFFYPHYSYLQEHLTPSTSIFTFPCFFMMYQSYQKVLAIT